MSKQAEWKVVNGGRGVFDGDKMIAAVYGNAADCSPDEAMQERAKLIAAAPALLEVLEWLDEIGGLGVRVHERIRAAIAKATE